MTDQLAWRAVRDSRTPALNGSDLRGDPKGPLFRITGRGMLEKTAAKRDHLSSRTTQLHYRRRMKLASMASSECQSDLAESTVLPASERTLRFLQLLVARRSALPTV